MTEEMINISDTSEEEVFEYSLFEGSKKSWAQKLKDEAAKKLRDIVKKSIDPETLADKASGLIKSGAKTLGRRMYTGKKK